MRAAIVVFDEAPHFLDHLAPLAIFLRIPLLLPCYQDYELVLKYYPEADCRFVHGAELVWAHLQEKYDLILYSTFNRKACEAEVGGLKTVFVPHGNSDKEAHKGLFQEEAMTFIYGERMRDFFEAKNCFVIGNYRKAYFAQKSYPSQLEFAKKQPTILYAPTLGSFHKEILDVPDDLNLVIKPHPLFARENRGFLSTIPSHIQVLEDYPLVYPLFEEVDLYVGDISSVGYDFLSMNKPLVFIKEETLYSHRFGRVVTSQNVWKGICEALEHDQKSYAEVRKEGYHYTFGPVPSREEAYQALRCYYEN